MLLSVIGIGIGRLVNLLVSEIEGRGLGMGIVLMIDLVIELLEAVKASLRAKVAQLAEDNWMYEPEEEPTMR